MREEELKKEAKRLKEVEKRLHKWNEENEVKQEEKQLIEKNLQLCDKEWLERAQADLRDDCNRLRSINKYLESRDKFLQDARRACEGVDENTFLGMHGHTAPTCTFLVA